MISKRVYETAEGWLKKRDDLVEEERSAFLNYIKPMKNVEALATTMWFVNEVIRVPEDQPKVNEAIKVAKLAKVDPLTHSSPMNILNTFKQYKIKEKAIDPDTIPELSNRQTIGSPPFSIHVYEVEDTKEGQLAMRKIINTHWGEDANPWCLLQGDSNGNLSSDAWQYWNHYNGVPKRVAFKDGKLLAFCANDYAKDYWWDRQDNAHNGISFDMKMPNDELGREASYEMDEYGYLYGPFDVHRGNKQNGAYEKWHDSGQLWYRENYKDGKREGSAEHWYENGQLARRANCKNGKLEGVWEEWYPNGQPSYRVNYKNGKCEGADISWNKNGDVIRSAFYKNGELDGWSKSWYDNGNMWIQTYYKDGKRNGTDELWRKDGSLQSRSNYKNDKLDGVREEWYENGQLESRCNYKDGWKDGVYEIRRSNGQLYSRSLYKGGNQIEDLTDDVRFRDYLDRMRSKEDRAKKITLTPRKKGGIKP